MSGLPVFQWTVCLTLAIFQPAEVRARYVMSSLRLIIHAAAPCPVDVKRRIIDALDARIGRQAHRIDRDEGGIVHATAPAVVVSVAVKPGDMVSLGDRLAVVEAMKMENELGSPKAGRVKDVLVSEAQLLCTMRANPGNAAQ